MSHIFSAQWGANNHVSYGFGKAFSHDCLEWGARDREYVARLRGALVLGSAVVKLRPLLKAAAVLTGGWQGRVPNHDCHLLVLTGKA